VGTTHLAVFTTADLVFAAVLAVLVFAGAVIAAWAAGETTGRRAERRRQADRDAADMATVADQFGPITAQLVSRIGDGATLRRVK
jgi:hypothetical protein